jgi:anti-anti-sigma factor
MDFEELKDGEVVILAPIGSLNTQTSPAFEQKIVSLLSGGSRRIVIDLRSVDLVTSAALRVLLVAGRRLGPGVGRLVLCGLNDEVRKVFSISGFDRDFAIVAKRGEAIPKAAEATVAAPPPPKAAAPAAPAPKAKAEPPPPPPKAAPAPSGAPPVAEGDRLGARVSAALNRGDSRPVPWTQWPSETEDLALRKRVLDVLSKA